MEKQNFEVYAVPKKSAYVLTKEQLKELESGKDKHRESIKRNAETFRKINLRIKDETSEELEPGSY